MVTFVKIIFWAGVATAVLRLLQIGICTFPRKVEKTLGMELVEFILGAAVTLWAGFLLYR